jgi:hypothetical protein
VRSIAGEVVLGPVAAVEEVGEGEGGGSGAEEGTCGDVEDEIDRVHAVEAVEHLVVRLGRRIENFHCSSEVLL